MNHYHACFIGFHVQRLASVCEPLHGHDVSSTVKRCICPLLKCNELCELNLVCLNNNLRRTDCVNNVNTVWHISYIQPCSLISIVVS